jgi:hypothetical protein
MLLLIMEVQEFSEFIYILQLKADQQWFSSLLGVSLNVSIVN